MGSPKCPLCWIEAHVGNPDGECATIRQVLESECLKAKRTIDATIGNKWPFCDILNEYFKRCSSGDNPGNPWNPSKYMQRGQTLPARQMWLLQEMCRRRGIDTKLIDPRIDYWENKAEIEREAHVRLGLKPRIRAPVVNNNEGRAVARLLQQRGREEEEAYAEYARAFKENH